MTTQHTPGPWTVHSTMRDCVTFKGRNGIENLFLQNIDGYFACQSESDARLIAAAPDLLEALHRLVDQIEWGAKIRGGEGYLGLYATKARAAIAKATIAEVSQ